MKRPLVPTIAVLALVIPACLLEAQVKINFWALTTQQSFLEPITREFEAANPNIDVEFVGYQVDPLKQALKVAAASRTLPDTWFTWGGSLGSFYVENGMTADLTQYARDRGWSRIYNKAAIDLVTYNGKVSGVPYHLNGMAVYYPKALLAKYRLTPPKTFTEFEAALRVLKSNGVTPLGFAGKNGWHLMRLTEALIETYGGPKVHDELLALSRSWKDPAVVKALSKIREWNEAGYFPKGFIQTDPAELELAFRGGSMGFNVEGPWWDGTMINDGFDPLSQDFFKFPTDQRPVRMSSFAEMFQISSQANAGQRAAALQLAEFLTSRETVTKYVDTYGSSALLNPPSTPKAPHVPAQAAALAEGNFLIADQALPQEVVQKLFEATDKVVLKIWTPDQGAAAIQTAVETFKKK